ncbi:MAG TPA: dTMP kinase [Candidatus Saccharimonadales bacterium]|nr:dTMP kinase [Candidatus Saccharimonadales bacterium]
MTRGKYIVVEGAEGVGKTTMVQLLAKQLQAAQLPVKIMREPDSQNDLTARAIRHLTQDPRYPMNTRTEVLLYNAARSQSLGVIREAVSNGVICLVDRSYLTTLAIQYYGRGDVPDYQTINDIINFAVSDMQPDLMVVLDAPVTVLRERVRERFAAERFDNLDEAFLERVRAGYLWEAKQRGLPVIYATDDIDTVFRQVWQHVAATLAIRDPHAKSEPQSIAEVLAAKPPVQVAAVEPPITTSVVETIEPAAPATAESSTPGTAAEATPPSSAEPWTIKHNNGSTSITPAGKIELAKYTTNTDGSIYSFTPQMSPVTVAAAMARLSRRSDDMRVTLLDEFIGKVEKDSQLLHRVITAYGDDSVQQLVGQHFVVEGASVLLTKKLEWGRLAAYLEQSTRYIYFDQKDEAGHYRYYTPPELKGKLRAQYVRTMDQIFDIYSDLVQKMTDHVRRTSTVPKAEQDGAWRSATKAQACDAIRDLLPLATKATVGIFASGQAFESLVMHLLSDELEESRRAGQELLAEGRKIIPVFLERADKPERGGATIAYRANTRAYVQQLAEQLLPSTHASPTEPVQLVSYTPHNELDIVADILYEFSDLPLRDLQHAVSTWPYEQKLNVLKAYIGERLNRRHRPGRALEKIHYSFDLTAKYGAFKDMQRHRMVDDLGWQEFSPRLGYDVPKLVEEAELTEQFERAFDLSLELYSALQAAHGRIIAQYAVLHGHNVRWKVTINAREAFQMLELRSSPQGHPVYRKLAQQMHAKIAEVHPQLAEAMIFMNQGEDPELARLAAERYTQYKLQQLNGQATEDTAAKK